MKKKSDKARLEIIKAAIKVLSRIGVSNMTLQVVADAASISKGALYYYYKSKDEILYDIMEQDNVHSRLLADKALDPEAEYDLDELKKDVTRTILKRFKRSDKNKLNTYLQAEALQGNSELEKKFTAKYHEWIKIIDSIFTRLYGVKSDRYTRTFSTILLGAIEGICMQYALMDEVEADEEFIGRIIMFLLSLNYEKSIEYIKNSSKLKFD